MSLVATLDDQLKAAMKSKDTLRRDTLRLLRSALKNFAIEKTKPVAELSDADVQSIIRRLVKQRVDSIVQYRAGDREDLATREEADKSILEAYLPASMPVEELKSLVETVIRETGATSSSQMGMVMGVAMKRVEGRATGDEVRQIVSSLLAS